MGETMKMFITVGKKDPVVFTYVSGLYMAFGFYKKARRHEAGGWQVDGDSKVYKTALGDCRRSVKLGNIAVEVDK